MYMQGEEYMITRMLELSTAHYKPETNDVLEIWSKHPEHPNSLLLVYKATCGYIIPVDNELLSDSQNSIPTELVYIMHYAMRKDCQYVRFDADAEELQDLPTWD